MEKPGYSERAYFEGVVNALIHRTCDFRGTEVHVEVYDDRLVISSPGGIYGGGELEPMSDGSYISKRCNPILADIFSRLRYVERQGNGMKKIFEATKNLYGYTEEKKPFFLVNKQNDFFLTIPNVNYRSEPVTIHDKIALFLSSCQTPRSREEMMEFMGLRNRNHFQKKYLCPLLEQEKIEMTIPEEPQCKN